VPAWLKVLEPEAEAADLEEEAVPDWLAELTPEAEVADAATVDEGTSDSLSEFMESLDEVSEPSGVAVEEELPDWLRDLDVGEDEPVGESLTVLESPEFVEPDAAEDGVLTDAGALSWLDSLTADMEEDQPVAAVVEPEDLTGEILVEGAADDETLELTIPPVDAAAWVDEVPDEQSEMLSGDDALAWLQSLTVGKEEEVRALAEAESEARVDEILGRKPAVPPSEPVAGSAEVEADVAAPAATEPEAAEVEIAPLREEDEPMSGDDAMAWLESLAADKEEEPQVQAEPGSVVAEMPEMEGPDSAPVVSDTAVETAVGELPEEESDLLSGDDAMAWLESLVVGKEDELRAQAEAESEARVDELLGRMPAVREPEPEVEIAAPPAAEMDIIDAVAEEPSGRGC
jgi:hypothetical protein